MSSLSSTQNTTSLLGMFLTQRMKDYIDFLPESISECSPTIQKREEERSSTLETVARLTTATALPFSLLSVRHSVRCFQQLVIQVSNSGNKVKVFSQASYVLINVSRQTGRVIRRAFTQHSYPTSSRSKEQKQQK